MFSLCQVRGVQLGGWFGAGPGRQGCSLAAVAPLAPAPTDLQLEVLHTPMPAVWCNFDAWGARFKTPTFRKIPPPGLEPGSLG